MLTDVLKVMVNYLFKENFYGRRKEKKNNILITFSIFHKSYIKTFLK